MPGSGLLVPQRLGPCAVPGNGNLFLGAWIDGLNMAIWAAPLRHLPRVRW